MEVGDEKRRRGLEGGVQVCEHLLSGGERLLEWRRWKGGCWSGGKGGKGDEGVRRENV